MKGKYRLEALLKVKARVRDRASHLLAKAIQKLEAERKKEKKLIEEKEKIVEKKLRRQKEMKGAMERGGLVRKGNVHLNFLRKLKEDQEAKEQEIDAQREVVAEAVKGVARARREYIDACKEYQIMEKHKQLWEKKTKAEISRREEKEFDELGNTIHQLRKWQGEGSDVEGALGS